MELFEEIKIYIQYEHVLGSVCFSVADSLADTVSKYFLPLENEFTTIRVFSKSQV